MWSRDGFEKAGGRFGKESLPARAAETDLGFSLAMFARMLGTLGRFEDRERPIADVQIPRVREFFAGRAEELAGEV